jgi:DNA-binding Lrp family transcriptional regulator
LTAATIRCGASHGVMCPADYYETFNRDNVSLVDLGANRLRRMEQAGIMRVVALTDIEVFGYELLAFGKIRIAGRAPLEVAAEVGRIPQILSAAVVTGRFDLFAVVAAGSADEVAGIVLQQIRAVPGVHRTETFQIWRTVKHAYTWARLGAANTRAT